MVRTPPFQGENPGSNPSGAAKNQKSPKRVIFYFCFTDPRRIRSEHQRHAVSFKNEVFVGKAQGVHDQFADEQLANLQKRICLIEFLRLGLVIVYQARVGRFSNTFTSSKVR